MKKKTPQKFAQGDLVKIKSLGCAAKVIQESAKQCAVEVGKRRFALRANGEEESFEILERVVVAKDDVELVAKAESTNKI